MKPLFYTFVISFLLLITYVFYCWVTLPDISKAVERTRLPATTIITEDGKEISSYGGVYSDIIYAEDLPDHVIDAIISTEDRRFYSHFGFDWQELRKMKSEYDHFGKKLRGCSTISQQVAKNCFTFGSRTLFRKIIEAYYTALIELIWGKTRILEVYMNIAETGVGIFGVEAACQKYFCTSCDAVDFDDAIALACVLPKPLARTPFIVRIAHSAKVSALSKTVLMKIDKLKD